MPQSISDDCDFFFPKDILVPDARQIKFFTDLKNSGACVADTSCDLFGCVLCLHEKIIPYNWAQEGKYLEDSKALSSFFKPSLPLRFFQRFLSDEEVPVLE